MRKAGNINSALGLAVAGLSVAEDVVRIASDWERAVCQVMVVTGVGIDEAETMLRDVLHSGCEWRPLRAADAITRSWTAPEVDTAAIEDMVAKIQWDQQGEGPVKPKRRKSRHRLTRLGRGRW